MVSATDWLWFLSHSGAKKWNIFKIPNQMLNFEVVAEHYGTVVLPYHSYGRTRYKLRIRWPGSSSEAFWQSRGSFSHFILIVVEVGAETKTTLKPTVKVTSLGDFAFENRKKDDHGVLLLATALV